ncbi:MAG TPA: carbamoyltransferase C-terminal domain-containing protein [Solirubrobacteraceae bacterium]|jgi:carbamoyltransferase|nr:carbamoyltransferase C-terminal domain-containing protein [Solirubrobacteraceae bacterium]
MAEWSSRAARPLFDKMLARHGLYSLGSAHGRSRLSALEQAVRDGREAYVLGIGAGAHNSGAALVQVSRHGTVEIVCNEEEERYAAIKHCMDYPEHSIEAVREQMRALGVDPQDLAACVSSWDYAGSLIAIVLRPVLEEAPASITRKLMEQPGNVINPDRRSLNRTPTRVGHQLGLGERVPIIGMRHHDNHAYFSYAVSPFAADPRSVMVTVIDGSGDDASTSLYECRDGRLTLLCAQGSSILDSLGSMYSFLSSTQGGWPPLSSEGRYMGAAAWGDGNRLTNRYYRRLKHLLHFGSEGEIRLNRTLTNWTRGGWVEPYGKELIEILGEPISIEDMWNPDAVLNVEDVRHPEITRDRVDKAAAVQMVFEDALVHTVDHLIRVTGSHRLVLTGGTALNCVANMRLLECFDESWYERHLGQRGTRLHLWVPPTPGDAGTPVGAAYAFAMRAGARPGSPLRHAFYCGRAPTAAAIRVAVSAEPGGASISLGDCSAPEGMARVADLLAHAVANDRIMGIYQGVAETGPRALGHRSILANPCNPDTRRLLNERVKHRELIRPLAPMLTHAAAKRFFHLEEGASDDDYNAYNYMVLTAHARPEAREAIPAVIHHDGTGRVQIVRPDVDPFCHEFLLAMGRRVGVEASVNTSLNVGAPIAHTPEQAIATLKRARGMDGLLMIDEDSQATLVWLEDRTHARERLMRSVRSWARETGFSLPDQPSSLLG